MSYTRRYPRSSCLPCTTAIRAFLDTDQCSSVTKRQLELAPRLVSEKAPSWRFLDGVCYDVNRRGAHYYRMDGLAGFEYGVE